MTTRQRFGRNAPIQRVLDAKPVSESVNMCTVLHCVYYSNDDKKGLQKGIIRKVEVEEQSYLHTLDSHSMCV
ncbi:hypothetical protein Hanom_Chr02g00161151 [Helianthus anomalus]